MKKETLVLITQDLVRELRHRGLDNEAAELLRAHYRDVKQQSKNAGLDHDVMIRSVRITLGICMRFSCKNKVKDDKLLCGRCRGRSRGYYKKHKKKINKKQREVYKQKIAHNNPLSE